MASLFRLLNTAIPFADPSRPLWCDVLLSLVLCAVLYVAPQVDWSALGNRLLETGQQMGQARPRQRVIVDEPAGEEIEEMEPDAEAETVGLQVEAGNGGLPAQEHNESYQQPAVDGPANPNPNQHQPRPRDPNREVGAKKAKSLARRNQQRAYNEWLREQGEAQRGEWARDAEKREEELRFEKERRAVAEAKIAEKERKERDERRAKDEEARREEIKAVERARHAVLERLEVRGIAGLEDVGNIVKRDLDWVKVLVRREGIVGVAHAQGGKQVTIATQQGWLVKMSHGMMEDVYCRAAKLCDQGNGKVTWEQLGRIIQDVVIKPAK